MKRKIIFWIGVISFLIGVIIPMASASALITLIKYLSTLNITIPMLSTLKNGLIIAPIATIIAIIFFSIYIDSDKTK